MKDKLQHKIDNKTKPLGALGQLERIATQIGLIQNTLTPELKHPAMLVYAADHGLSEEGISPYPKEVTFQMVMNILNGGAAISIFCQQNGIDLKVIDAGVDYDFPENTGLINAKIARGTKNSCREAAMSTEECNLALQKGAEFVKAEADNGCNIIGFGEMGIGNTSAAALLMHKFTGLSLDQCVGAGTGFDSKGVQRKREVLEKVAQKHHVTDPKEVLAAVGGLEIAMMCGGMLEARKQGMVIMVDGFIATSAFLTAFKIDPTVKENAIFCHQSDENGHKYMLEHLKAEPILDMSLRLGEGTGAALAYPIIQSAVNFLNNMASFEDAGVSNKE